MRRKMSMQGEREFGFSTERHEGRDEPEGGE
jgi:hypothetical protein